MEGREQTGRVNHALAERINQYILEQKSSIAAISKEIGYSRTSVSRYLSGKYDSCASTMEEKLAEFLAAHTGETVEAPAAPARSGKRPSFYESKDARSILGVCQSCQEYTGLGIVVAKSGFGKTYALRQIAEAQIALGDICLLYTSTLPTN